ncbi:MAG: PAS domain S-box protein [Desulfobacteraceae bacterium]|nr:MAG: PAS domain S-box protein [Desulfobacteraceae bacterium]
MSDQGIGGTRVMFPLNGRLSGLLTKECAKRGVFPEHGLIYWRERILLAVVGTAVLLSSLAAVPSFILAIKEKLWLLLLLDVAALCLGLILLFVRKIPYRIRATVVVMGFYGVGLGVVLNAGLLSGGPAWLFTFGAMAGLLLGLNAGLLAVLLNLVTLAFLGFLYQNGSMGENLPYYLSGIRAFSAGGNFILLNLIVAISSAVLVRGIEFAAKKERDISRFLAEEKDRLIEARKRLEHEVGSRREAERLARESEARYRLLADNVSDIIWTLDLETLRYTYISPSVLKMRGYAQREAMDLTMEETLSPRSLKEVRETLVEEFERDGSPGVDPLRSRTIEVEQICKDGSYSLAEVTVTFIRDAEGKPVELLGVSRDIRERRRAEKEKRELEKRLLDAKRMEAIATLAGGVAHQFNNALSVVGLSLEAMRMAQPLSEKQTGYLKNIKTMNERMAGLAAQLLAYARGGMYKIIEIPAAELMEASLRLVSHIIKPPIRLEKEIPEGLWSVRVDITQIQMVISAVLANASEAIEGDGRIMVRCRNFEIKEDKAFLDQGLSPGRYVCVAVRDSGKGMDSETLARIFEPFFSTKFQGRGLGMAAVYGIVKNHEGHVDVESAPGEGTIVRIYLRAAY